MQLTVLAQVIAGIAAECGLFAACLFLVFALDDLLVDAIWLTHYRRARLLSPGAVPDLHFAVFIPAWHEERVIGAMLATLCQRWPWDRLTIFVGVYPNDPATRHMVALAQLQYPRIIIVETRHPGPTTKADCLNHLWRAAVALRADGRCVIDAVLLHDAEDVVDAAEPLALAQALQHADFAQTPVRPLHHAGATWIGGHYGDEFAVGHRRDMFVRSIIGAPLPLAGAGCAIRWEWLARLDHGDGPFASDSLTEDYELGLRLSALGARGTLSRYRQRARLIVSQAYFPRKMGLAVRQKTRWLLGNALRGWDRLGWIAAPRREWRYHIGAVWMLWRDRRSLLSALAILCGYLAILLMLTAFALAPDRLDSWDQRPLLAILCLGNFLILLWRCMIRALCVAREYGLVQALLSILRLPVSNLLLIGTAFYALFRYWQHHCGRPLVWDKTDHHFPDQDVMGH